MAPPRFRRPVDFPNMEMIESSLRRCSLSQRAAHAGRGHLVLGGLDRETAGITVDLNSEAPPLPHPWEQFLNIQTGEIYYVNKFNGTKTSHDPRRYSTNSDTSDSEPESILDDGEETNLNDSSSDESSGGSNCISATSSPLCSSSSSAISTATSASSHSTACGSASAAATRHHRHMEGSGSPVLVLVGCKVCFTLSMVARSAAECAKCGSVALRRF